MDLSRNTLTVSRSPWEREEKTSQWLSQKAAEGWFVDSFKFKFFNISIQFRFVRCEPVEANIYYEEVSSINWDPKYYESTLPE